MARVGRFPGEIAGASLKRASTNLAAPVSMLVPRRNRRGLIEASRTPLRRTHASALFPGEIAGASLKRDLHRVRGRLLLRRGSPAKSPGPH